MVMLLVIVAGAGCSSSRPIPAFEDHLEKYVNTYGHGDLNVLRELPPDSVRKQFGVVDDTLDVQGVLLGAKNVDSRTWYIYLVGVTRDRDLQDLRLMAVARQDDVKKTHDEYDWCVGSEDKINTNRYRADRLKLWRTNQPVPPPDDKQFGMNFPAPDDVFKLTVTDQTATVIHEHSGAQWHVLLNEYQRQPKIALSQ
jgi:hypothetical protein